MPNRALWQRIAILLLMPILSLPARAANLTVTPLNDGVYLMRSERAVEGFGLVSGNGLIVQTAPHKAVLIDTPLDNSDVDTLFSWLESQGLMSSSGTNPISMLVRASTTLTGHAFVLFARSYLHRSTGIPCPPP